MPDDLKCVIQFVQIALFKALPQDLQASNRVLLWSIGLAFVVGMLRYVSLDVQATAFVRVVLEIFVPGLLVFALLRVFGLSHRFLQTFSAICGSAAFIYLLALPVLPAFYRASASSENTLPFFIVLLLDFWSVAVFAYILKHAMDIALPIAISLSIALGLLALLIVDTIAPITFKPVETAAVVFNIWLVV